MEDAQYRLGVVTLIDVLGFQDLIRRGDASRVKRVLEAFYSEGQDIRSPRSGFYTYAFSDTVVRVTVINESEFSNQNEPTESSRLARAVEYELTCLGYAQHALIVYEGVFIRGAITVGPILCYENAVFGPALVDAHLLETKRAIHPRIIIGDPILEQMAKCGARLSFRDPIDRTASRPRTDWDSVNYFIYREDDPTTYFLDYFPFPSKEGDSRLVLKHREQIVRAYKGATTDRIKEKYAWTANYHNSSLRSFEFREIGVTDTTVASFEIGDLEQACLADYTVKDDLPPIRFQLGRILR